MNYWFTSDQHFGHKKMAALRGFYKKPNLLEGEVEDPAIMLNALNEMNETLIENYNSVVKCNDVVYMIGDFSFQNEELAIQTLKRLNGNITLVEGNHDRKRKKMLRAFSRVERVCYAKIGGYDIVMCHFPMLIWHKHQYGSLHFHGHSHGNLHLYNPEYYKRKVTDVGVDAPNMKLFPMNFDELSTILETRDIVKVDHHYEDD